MDHQSASHRSKSESPSTMSSTVASVSNVHRTSTAPQFNNMNTTSTTVLAAPWITPLTQSSYLAQTTHVTESTAMTSTGSCCTSTAASDVALMSTLLRALRSYSTTAASSSACHGSPVMVLKEMIDKHFSETASAAVTSPSPVNNRINTAAIASHVCTLST